MSKIILNWIKRLDKKNSILGGRRVCPFAAKARYKIIEQKTTHIQFDRDMFDSASVLIYKMNRFITAKQLEIICDRLNRAHKDHIFLPDHQTYKTKIKDVMTSNGVYNLILCQSRSELLTARDVLEKKGYYRLWDKNYLKDVWDH